MRVEIRLARSGSVGIGQAFTEETAWQTSSDTGRLSAAECGCEIVVIDKKKRRFLQIAICDQHKSHEMPVTKRRIEVVRELLDK